MWVEHRISFAPEIVHLERDGPASSSRMSGPRFLARFIVHAGDILAGGWGEQGALRARRRPILGRLAT